MYELAGWLVGWLPFLSSLCGMGYMLYRIEYFARLASLLFTHVSYYVGHNRLLGQFNNFVAGLSPSLA